MGGEISKYQQILNYYMFQKKIDKVLTDQNTEDNKKTKYGFFIHPDWIKEWKKMIGYTFLSKYFDTLKIENNYLNKKETQYINENIKTDNIYIDINTSFLIKTDNFILLNERIINRELLENFVDNKTFTELNINKKTKFEEINYIFKKQMIIFFFKDYKTIKMVIHLPSYNNIDNLINLKFIFNDFNRYIEYRTKFKTDNSENIIEFLNSMNIFKKSKHLEKDLNDKNIFELYNESKYEENTDEMKIKKNIKSITTNQNKNNNNSFVNKDIKNSLFNKKEDKGVNFNLNQSMNNIVKLNNNLFNFNINNNLNMKKK